MISVFLFGNLRDKVPGHWAVDEECVMEMDVEEGETIASIMEKLSISPEEVAHMFLNYQYSASTRKVRSGDRLALFAANMSVLYRQYFVKHTD